MGHRRLLLFLLLFSNAAAFAAAPPRPRDVDITAPDGFKLRATYYPAARPGPGVVLLHMCNTDRKSWAPLAPQLAAAGINTLTVDNRGFGESGAIPADAPPEKQNEIRQHWPADFDAVFAYLVAQTGVDKARIGIGGGSCGVQNAVTLARHHAREVKSLVLLAGPTDTAGIYFLLQNSWLPIFTAAAADDQYDADAPQMMNWLAAISGNPRDKFMGFADGRHGTEIFPVHPELPRAITEFLVDTLITSPSDAKTTVKVKESQARQFWTALDSPGGVEKAIGIFHESRKSDPKAYLFPEAMLNLAGYGRLQDGDTKGAIELFKLNVEAYPDSANVYDSLSDAYLATGQNDLALAAVKKTLEKLPGDKNNEQFKTALKQVSEQKLVKLQSASK